MRTHDVAESEALNLRVGQLVEVLSADEIRATLDERGELDSLPFMPEMLQYCGRRFTVVKVAHKVCDTMHRTGMRRMNDAVHLAGLRCDGQGHGGCQAACLIYWKEAWLRRVDPGTPTPEFGADSGGSSRLLPLLVVASRRPPIKDGEEAFFCQATELLRAAPEPLPLRDLRQYVRDVQSGNVGPAWVSRAFLVGLFNKIQSLSTRFLPRWLWFREGERWKFLKGIEGSTPTLTLDLQPGELVRIKSKAEIMKTLNQDLRNRGLGFDPEMARFCGRTARVARRVNHIVDERTGRMLRMKNPCIVLDRIVCEGAYNASCPRSIPCYWREIWLERIEVPA